MIQGSRRKYQKICLQFSMLLCCIILLLIIKRLYVEIKGYMPEQPVEQINRDFDKYLVKYENNYWKEDPVKKVVIWTPFFGKWGWVEDAQKSIKQCPVACTFTKEKAAVKTADAVLFHANDLWPHKGLLATLFRTDIAMPEYRTPNQVWAMVSWEPMIYMWGNIKPNTFNWTMLYRRESTIYNPFTSLYKMTPEEVKASKVPKNTEMFLREKTKFASTMVSNCYDQAKRYKIIRELQRYVDVDNFGSCTGNMVCPHGVPTAECGKRYLKKYKFYLAFENSFCRDYVSEKFWNALSRHQIPVIAAPKYNLELLPPNSYLNVFDFPSIKALAERMIEIGNNETLYNSFFDWTRYYKTVNEDIHCKLCKRLHANVPAQSYRDIEAWISDDMCYKSTVSILLLV